VGFCLVVRCALGFVARHFLLGYRFLSHVIAPLVRFVELGPLVYSVEIREPEVFHQLVESARQTTVELL